MAPLKAQFYSGKRLKLALSSGVILIFLSFFSSSQWLFWTFHPLPDSASQGFGGVVSSENSICSQIGIDILKEGGGAIDAVIGTTLCIGVTNLQSSGIGGNF